MTAKILINRKETKGLRYHPAVLGIEEWNMIVSFVSYRQSETMVLRLVVNFECTFQIFLFMAL